MAAQTGNAEVWQEKHLQVKPEELRVVNAQSLQPRGTQYNRNYFPNCGNKILMKYCMCHQGEIPMYNTFLCLLSSNEISSADWFNASSVWFTVDPSICFNVKI